MLVADLQDYHQQFQAIKIDAGNLLADLTAREGYWQPDKSRWSIALCLDHLLITGRHSLTNLRLAITDARAKGIFSQGPFRYGMIERWFVRQMDARATMRWKAPPAYRPTNSGRFEDLVRNFFALQEEFLHCIDEANGIDLARVKVANPVSRWFRLSVGQEIAFTAAHERRHLWQARLVKQERNFAWQGKHYETTTGI